MGGSLAKSNRRWGGGKHTSATFGQPPVFVKTTTKFRFLQSSTASLGLMQSLLAVLPSMAVDLYYLILDYAWTTLQQLQDVSQKLKFRMDLTAFN